MLLPSQHISESHQALLFEQSQSLRGEVIEFGRGNKLNVVIAKGDAKNDKVLIIFNPNGVVLKKLLEIGFDDVFKSSYSKIVLWDYPNTGGSSGKFFLNPKQDLVDAGQEVTRHIVNNHGIEAKNITFYGWSLGGGVAAEAAVKLEALGIKVSGLIVDRSFTSITDYMKKNMFIPKFISKPLTLLFSLNLNTKENFDKFKGNKKSIYTLTDEVIGKAIFSGEGENFIKIELGHMDIIPPSPKYIAF